MFLKYDFSNGARLLGRLIPCLVHEEGVNTVFGGVVTDVQPDQSAGDALTHTSSSKKFMEVSVIIHGRVDCFMEARHLHPTLARYVILARWYKPSDRHVRGARRVPNASLFVI